MPNIKALGKNSGKIVLTQRPHSADIDFLTQKINAETTDKKGASPFAFFLRDAKGAIIAGCNGFLVFGGIYTDQLWVHPQHRNRGIGKELMEKVHDLGRQEGCTLATVATLSFQEAQKFYEKLGYSVEFERHGYSDGAICFFLRKNLIIY